MSHYDDLGVARDASPEEIREAYRILVRLLHPDQQTDPVLKRAAEGQMRRINASYAVLSDPEQRRKYDREAFEPTLLRNPGTMTPGPMPLRRPIQPGSLVWVAVAVLSLGAIFWLAIESQ